MKISVVIPAYGPTPYLERCLTALEAQTLPPLEITVFHSGPDDPTEALSATHPNVRVTHSDTRHFAGGARNAGAQGALGDLLVFVDSDVLVASGFLEAIARAADDHPDSVFIGSLGRYPAGGVWSRVAWFIEFGSVFPNRPAHSANSAPSACFGISRVAFEKSGGFRTDLFAAEDGDFFVRLRQAGLTLRFVPTAQGDHVFSGGGRRTLARLAELGQAAAFLRRTHELPGSAAVRHPPLAALLPFARMGQMLRRLVTENGPVGQFLLLSPLIFAGLCAWALGFYREARRPLYPTPSDTVA
ncbi:MAG: glycosyltransferase family A protein [Pseudomonadota bacterium]